jgi:hypothetical protein
LVDQMKYQQDLDKSYRWIKWNLQHQVSLRKWQESSLQGDTNTLQYM